MTSTISLLVDIPHERIEQLLEDGSHEELVDWCKEIHDKDALSIVDADEIAWREALGIFLDNSDTE